MKKVKFLLVAALAVVMVLSLALVACDKTPALESISVDTSAAKVAYKLGEEYSASGLVVSAHSEGVEEAEVLAADAYVVDSSAYKKDVAGQYAIKVSYTVGEVTKEASYNVNVYDMSKDNLIVTTQSSVYNLSSATYEYVIAEEIAVYGTDTNGNKGALVADGYTVTILKAGQEVQIASGKAQLGAGEYTIRVSAPSALVASENRSGEATITVKDALVGLKFKGSVAGTVATQAVGTDSMTSTWKYVATYASGATKDLAAADVTATVDVATAGTKQATVSYTDDGVTKQTEVTYIVVAPLTEGYVMHEMDYATVLEAAKGVYGNDVPDKSLIEANWFVGNNTFLQPLPGEGIVIRPTKNCIEIKDDSIAIVVYGTGELQVTVSSTGSSNHSRIGLKNASGAYIAATDTDITGDGLVASGDEAGAYDVSTEKTLSKLTWSNLPAGRYILTAPSGERGRGAQLKGLALIDYFGNKPEVKTLAFSFKDLQAAMLAAGAEADSSDANKVKDGVALAPEHFTGVNSFITLENPNENTKIRSGDSCIELKETAVLKVSVGASGGTLKVTVSSNGRSNKSGVWFVIAGQKVHATDARGAVLLAADDELNPDIYEVTGTGSVVLTLELDHAATVEIHSLYNYMNNDAPQSRGCRVKAIELSTIAQ